MTDFQTRRRRAAKLTQFFGVDYRELITDVLNSIESGLEHEQGYLQEEEMEVSCLSDFCSCVIRLTIATGPTRAIAQYQEKTTGLFLILYYHPFVLRY